MELVQTLSQCKSLARARLLLFLYSPYVWAFHDSAEVSQEFHLDNNN